MSRFNPNATDTMALSPMRPTDGVAWITGASSGIGRETARALAIAGWTVHATARKREDLEALYEESGGKIIPAPGDVTDRAGMEALVARIEEGGQVIALALLNAGLYLPVMGDKLEIDPFDQSFAINLTGTVNALVPVAKRMQARGKGQIAITSSVTAYGGLPTSAAYGATKAGLTNMAESLKFDFDRMGILLQIIHPGFVKTPATDKNRFSMPFIIPAEEAARRIVSGLQTTHFEIAFPRRFTYFLKALNLLPYRFYFPLVAWATRAK